VPKAPRGLGHFHLALAVRPDAVRSWSDDEVVDRWQRIYRSKCEKANAERRAQMLADPSSPLSFAAVSAVRRPERLLDLGLCEGEIRLHAV